MNAPRVGWREDVVLWSGRILMSAALLGVASLALEYGFRVEPHVVPWLHAVEAAVVVGLVLDRVLRLAAATGRGRHVVEHRLEFVLLLLLAVALGVFRGSPAVVAQGYIAAALLLEAARLNARIASMAVRPAGVVAAGFLVLIVAGTGLLLLPRASANPAAPIGFVDAVFTATSAVCVTGLTVRDTGTDFSALGRGSILVLIQLGGLGLVTYISVFTLLQQRSIGVRQSILLKEILSTEVIGGVGRMLRFVLAATLGFELLGALAIWAMFPGQGFGWAVFHSVSGFCNAGFAYWPASAPSHAGLLLVLLVLTVVGGLGFPVLQNLWDWVVSPRPRAGQRLTGRLPARPRITLQAKLALGMSAVLLVGGAAAFLVLEWNGLLAGRPLADRVLVSFFQSGVARTSGFTAVDLTRAAPATDVVTIGLMSVGASPASTGGGLKTITLVLLAAAVWSMLRNRTEVELLHRTLPRFLVNAAVSVVMLYGLGIFGFSLALSFLHPELEYRRVLFETVSALSTVGLTSGATAQLGAAGRLVLCAAMFVGRLGPLVVLLSISSRAPSAGYRYPREGLIVS